MQGKDSAFSEINQSEIDNKGKKIISLSAAHSNPNSKSGQNQNYIDFGVDIGLISGYLEDI